MRGLWLTQLWLTQLWLTQLLALSLSAAVASPALAADWVSTPDSAPELALVEVLAPSPATHLMGGQWARLTWQPGRDLALFPLAREWEAFLSLDGGVSFPLRITPHLDLDQRSCRFQVPNLDAHDVRLLIRVGNEDQELPQLVAGRWQILADPSAASGRSLFERGVLWSREPGEKARPTDHGVVAWAEPGASHGEFQQVRQLPSRSWGRQVEPGEVLWGVLTLFVPEPRPRDITLLPSNRWRTSTATASLSARPQPTLPQRVSTRLLESRFNE